MSYVWTLSRTVEPNLGGRDAARASIRLEQFDGCDPADDLVRRIADWGPGNYTLELHSTESAMLILALIVDVAIGRDGEPTVRGRAVAPVPADSSSHPFDPASSTAPASPAGDPPAKAIDDTRTVLAVHAERLSSAERAIGAIVTDMGAVRMNLIGLRGDISDASRDRIARGEFDALRNSIYRIEVSLQDLGMRAAGLEREIAKLESATAASHSASENAALLAGAVAGLGTAALYEFVARRPVPTNDTVADPGGIGVDPLQPPGQTGAVSAADVDVLRLRNSSG